MYPRPFPQAGSGDVQVFNQPSTVTAVQLHTWQKPRGCSLVYILCIGGGGGGGGGTSGTAGTSRNSGGGGGSSSTTRILIPAYLLPDRLYIQVGAGGAGGAADGNGSAGILSYVTIHPAATITATNVIAVSGNAAATGGTAGGAAGAAGTIATIANMPLAGMGRFQFIAGQIGRTGGGASNPAVFPTTGVITMGGPSGANSGGTDQPGPGITAITDSLLSEMRPVASTAASPDASGGIIANTFFSYCGLGGGTLNASTGGTGGNAAYGSGGGGGGAGTTGGRGGDGGNGVVIIISA